MAPLSRFGPGDGRAHAAHRTGTHVPGAEVHRGGAGAHRAALRIRSRHAASSPAVLPSPVARRFLLLVAVVVGLVACAGEPAASFDPAGPAPRTARSPGAYPDLEALVPATYRDAPPEAVDSGRNCSRREARVAGRARVSTRSGSPGRPGRFGAERAVVLAVFSATGPRRRGDVADFYAESARAEPRRRSSPSRSRRSPADPAAGSTPRRVERLQTVVVWPAADPDVVNVVITNDLPDARIQEAIDAFGDR